MSHKIEVGMLMRVVESETNPEYTGKVGKVNEIAVWQASGCVVTSIWLDFTPDGHMPQMPIEFRLYHGSDIGDRDRNILERA